MESLKADCEVRRGKASGALGHIWSRGVCAEGVTRFIQRVNPNFGIPLPEPR
jgi:hypothetical protein